jgi:peroxiredoxin
MKTFKIVLVTFLLGILYSPAFSLLPVGTDAPDFTLVDVNGVSHKLSDYKGQVVLIEFFSMSCESCHKISDFLEGLYQDPNYKDKGFVIFAIDFKVETDTIGDVRDYIDLYEWTFPAFFDENKIVPNLYDWNGYLPTSITIGKDMKIYNAVDSYHDEGTFRSWIDGALSQQIEDKLTITITTDKNLYEKGNDMVNCFLELKNPGEEVPVDIAIAILHVQSNDQQLKLWFLPDWSINYHPYQLTLPKGYSLEKTQLLSLDSSQHPFTELGEYTLAAAVFEPGTTNFISLSTVVFNIVVF